MRGEKKVVGLKFFSSSFKLRCTNTEDDDKIHIYEDNKPAVAASYSNKLISPVIVIYAASVSTQVGSAE